MAVVSNSRVEENPRLSATPPTAAAATRVFVPLVTPFLYGMERAVIELFDALRPDVEPYFLQSNRILQREFPVIREMKRRGFEIQYLPDQTDWERPAKPRSLKHLWQMIVASVRSNFAVLKGVRGKDVLYVPGISAASSSLLAAMYCRFTGRRVLHHFHDLGTTNWLFPLWMLFVSDCVHNTEFGFQAVCKNRPRIRSKRNFIVPNLTEVDDRLPDDAGICRELQTQRNLFFVGQISRHKGVDLLLQAFNIVATKHSDVTLHLIGEGKEEFRNELENGIASAGLQRRVKFWGFREDATRFLRFAYLYVHSSPPSRFHESFGRSVVEAMAQGVPVVCFRSGALQEILSGQTGELCDETASSLADGIDDFLSDADFRNHCGHCAKQRYQNVFSGDKIRRCWIDLILCQDAERSLQRVSD